MISALIAYASFTGNTEQIAKMLQKAFIDLGIQAEMKEGAQMSPKEFLHYDIAVVATYTYGAAANLPEEIEDFYFEMEQLKLPTQVYGVLGSGETFYDKFCQSVLDFDVQFQKTGAIKGTGNLLIEEAPNDEDHKNIVEFARNLLHVVQDKQIASE